MIFKTITDEATGATKSISVFNSTIGTMQRNLSSGQGVMYSIFGGNKLRKNDITALNNYVNGIKSGLTPAKSWMINMRGCSVAAKQYVLDAKKAGKSTQELSAGLKTVSVTSKMASVGMKALSIAGNMLMFLAITEGIQLLVKGLDALIVTTEEAKEALEESVSSFESTTNEVKSLEDELKTCTERLDELQKLADNNTISVAEEKELELLKQTNDELERKLALKKEEQLDDAKQVLKDAKRYSDKEIMSSYAYVAGTYEQGAPQYASVLAEDELAIAFDKYYSSTNIPTANQIDPKKVIEDTYAMIAPTIEAYETLIASGYKLSESEQQHYNKLSSLQDKYLKFRYDINGLKETYQALSVEQQKQILLEKLIAQGLSKIQAQSVLDNVSEDDYTSLWEKGFSFTPPEITDYSSAEDYGKAYAQAWLNGVSGGIQDDKPNPLTLSDTQIKDLGSYQKNIQTISKSIADLNNLDSSDITSLMTDFSEYGDVFEKFGVNGVKGIGNLRGALVEIARQMKETATNAVPQMSSAIEDMYKIISNPKGSIEEFSSEISELEEILQKSQNGENIENIESLINKYGDLEGAIVETVDGGFSFEESAVIKLLNARIELYNSAVAFDLEQTKSALKQSQIRAKNWGIEANLMRDIASEWNGSISDMGNFLASKGVDESFLSSKVIQDIVNNSLDFVSNEDYIDFLEKLGVAYKELIDTTKEDNSKNSTIDWMTTSLGNLQEAVDDANNAFDNAKGIEAQKEALASLNGELEKLKLGYISASAEYSSRYETALSKLGGNRAEIQRKIEAGDVFDAKEFPSEFADIINEAIEAWNGMRDADNKVAEIGIQIDENSIKSLELDSDHYSSLKAKAELELELADDKNREKIYDSLVDAVSDYYDTEIKIANIKGDTIKALTLELEKTKELRDIENDRLEKQRSILEGRANEATSRRKLAESKLDVPRSDKDTSLIYDEIERHIKAEYSAKYALAEFDGDKLGAKEAQLQQAKALYELEQKRLELSHETEKVEITQIEHQLEQIENQQELNDGHIDPEELAEAYMLAQEGYRETAEELAREQAILERIKQQNGINSSEYRTQLALVYSISNGLNTWLQKIKSFGAQLLSLPFGDIDAALNNYDEQIESANSALEGIQKQMEAIDNIISGAQAYIQDQIDAQEELKKPIEEELEALKKSNDEREHALSLQKAQYELERAYRQRTVKTYVGEDKGFVYTQDRDSIRDAQENIDNWNYKDATRQLEKQLEHYDEIIDNLKEIQDAWGQVKQNAQDTLNIQKAIAEIGVSGIMSMDMAAHYEQTYIGLLQSQESLGNLSESLSTKKKELEDLRAKLEEIVNQYQRGEFTLREATIEMQNVLNQNLSVIADAFPDISPVAKAQEWIDEIKEAADMYALIPDLVGRIKGAVDTAAREGYSDISGTTEGIANLFENFFNDMVDDLNEFNENFNFEFDFTDSLTDTSAIEDYLNNMRALGVSAEQLSEEDFKSLYDKLLEDNPKFAEWADACSMAMGQVEDSSGDMTGKVKATTEELLQSISTTLNEVKTGLLGTDGAISDDVDKTTSGIQDKVYETSEKVIEETNKSIEETSSAIGDGTDSQLETIQNYSDSVNLIIQQMCKDLSASVTTSFGELNTAIITLSESIAAKVESIVATSMNNIAKLQSVAKSAEASSNITISNPTMARQQLPWRNENLVDNLFANGGLITTYDKELEGVAHKLGEDHITTIGYKEGERILTPEQNKLWENLINDSFNPSSMFKVQPVKLPEINKVRQNAVPVIQNVNLTLPNVTNDGGYNRVVQELKGLQLEALQFSNRK